MRPYEVILHERAWTTLASTRGAETRRLLGWFDELKDHPFRPGDFPQYDASGRRNEVLLPDDWLVTYWSDHAACTIHLVDLERVDA